MSRLPATFEGRRIRSRIPYSMPGEIVMLPGQANITVPTATFVYRGEEEEDEDGDFQPFEIHRLVPRLTALNATNVVVVPNQPAVGLMERMIQLRLYDHSEDELLTKNLQFISTLIKGQGAGVEQTWEWAEPYTIRPEQGFEVTVANFVTAATAARVRVELAFQGFKLDLEED